jgi:hypothetical protein
MDVLQHAVPWLLPDTALPVGRAVKLGVMEENEDVIGSDMDVWGQLCTMSWLTCLDTIRTLLARLYEAGLGVLR